MFILQCKMKIIHTRLLLNGSGQMPRPTDRPDRTPPPTIRLWFRQTPPPLPGRSTEAHRILLPRWASSFLPSNSCSACLYALPALARIRGPWKRPPSFRKAARRVSSVMHVPGRKNLRPRLMRSAGRLPPAKAIRGAHITENEITRHRITSFRLVGHVFNLCPFAPRCKRRRN